MSALLETLRALAPVVTPGPQHFQSMINPGRFYICAQQAAIFASEISEIGETRKADLDAIVTLRNALPTIIAALKVAELVRDEDWLAERISDTLDVDWRPIDAARAIIAALPGEEVK